MGDSPRTLREEAVSPENRHTMVRAIYSAVAVDGMEPPFNVAHLKLFYPAELGLNDAERNTGQVSVATACPSMPVAVVLPGINVSPHMTKEF